jgi:Rap1a immunity proteins
MTAGASGGVMRSMLVTTALATIAAVVLMETTALPQVDTNSGNYMLPLCQAFLRMQSHDMAAITNELSTGGARSGGIPLSMMQAGMCAGEVIGIAEMLKASDQAPRACIPKEVTKEQLVRVVVASVEKDPANMHEDFGTLAAATIVAAWPCQK